MHGPSSRILFNVVMLEPGERLWNRGSWLANWNSIMGPAWWLWFVPYGNTPGDGIHDVYNEDVYRRLVSDALAQARLQLANIGVLGDNGIGKGPWPGRGGGYGTYGSHSRRHSKARDRGNHYHSGGSSKQGSSNNSRTGQIGAPQGGGRGVTGEGSVSTGHCADSYTRQQPTREKRTADRDGATNLPIDTPHRPNIHSASEPASVNPSRSPSPDGRADRAAAGSRKTLKRMGTAPSTLMPSTVRFQNDQDNIPTARQRAETYGATPSGWAVAEASHPSQSYLVPPPTKPVPPGPRRHARQRTLSSNRSQGGGSSIGRGPGGGNEFSSGGFGLGIDGDGIAVNSSTLLRLTTEDQRSAGGRSSPSSSGRKGHRRHHSARGSSDPHHHHHHSHHNHHHHHHTQHQPIPAHPRTTARILAAPPISPDSDDAFQPPVLSPTMPRNVGPSSELPRTLPRSQSHDPQQSIAPLVHRSPDGDSQDSKSKGKAVMESKTYIGRQRHRTVDVMITTNTVAEQEDVAVGVSPSDVGSEPSLDQPFLTPSASPIDEPSPLHLPYFEPSKSTILPTHSQQEQHQSQLVL
ncbi:hypothetical protein BGZ73_007140 [Actinomortierella ambigua]|nr:hypothetical protein BGZ73_007140 [Actinomortierella ambigua]